MDAIETARDTTDDIDGLIAKAAVRQITTFSDTTLWRRVRAGEFPEPVRISPGRVAWRKSDVRAWIAKRAGDSR